uniref:Uncharacterized protein n=1 Tax=Glossina austeni TaxID=7395 RepID=A0A1A9V970_GLOAU
MWSVDNINQFYALFIKSSAVAVIVKVLQLYCNNGKTTITVKRTAAASAATLVSSSFGACRIQKRKKVRLHYILKERFLVMVFESFEILLRYVLSVPCSTKTRTSTSFESISVSKIILLLPAFYHDLYLNNCIHTLQLNSNKNGYESAQF